MFYQNFFHKFENKPTQSNHNHDQQPSNSLTGLEEALEELRRYEDDDAIEYYPKDYPNTSQTATTSTTTTTTNTTSSIHPVDPLSAYLNPPPIPPSNSAPSVSQLSAMYTIPTSSGDDNDNQSDGPTLTTLIPPAKSVVHSQTRYPPASVSYRDFNLHLVQSAGL